MVAQQSHHQAWLHPAQPHQSHSPLHIPAHTRNQPPLPTLVHVCCAFRSTAAGMVQKHFVSCCAVWGDMVGCSCEGVEVAFPVVSPVHGVFVDSQHCRVQLLCWVCWWAVDWAVDDGIQGGCTETEPPSLPTMVVTHHHASCSYPPVPLAASIDLLWRMYVLMVGFPKRSELKRGGVVVGHSNWSNSHCNPKVTPRVSAAQQPQPRTMPSKSLKEMYNSQLPALLIALYSAGPLHRRAPVTPSQIFQAAVSLSFFRRNRSQNTDHNVGQCFVPLCCTTPHTHNSSKMNSSIICKQHSTCCSDLQRPAACSDKRFLSISSQQLRCSRPRQLPQVCSTSSSAVFPQPAAAVRSCSRLAAAAAAPAQYPADNKRELVLVL